MGCEVYTGHGGWDNVQEPGMAWAGDSRQLSSSL